MSVGLDKSMEKTLWEDNNLFFPKHVFNLWAQPFYCFVLFLFVGDNPSWAFLAETTQVHQRRSHPFKNLSRINRTSFFSCVFWEDYHVFSKIWANAASHENKSIFCLSAESEACRLMWQYNTDTYIERDILNFHTNKLGEVFYTIIFSFALINFVNSNISVIMFSLCADNR